MTTVSETTTADGPHGTAAGAARGTTHVTVRYFAAAAEAAGTESETLAAGTMGELRTAMVDRHGADLERVLTRCSVLHDGARLSDEAAVLPDGAVVDVLPPFAGG